MFERYSQAARDVIFSARFMAIRIGGREIETDHLLLGLLSVDKDLARRFLGSPWAAEDICKRIDQNKPRRERIASLVGLPLSRESKSALVYAVAEADLVSNAKICTDHLLLGLLREDKSYAAEILRGCGVRLEDVRAALLRAPHDDSVRTEFVRETGPRPQDITELQSRIKSIMRLMEEAIKNQDLETAKTYLYEQAEERDKLFLLYQRYGLLDWIFDD